MLSSRRAAPRVLRPDPFFLAMLCCLAFSLGCGTADKSKPAVPDQDPVRQMRAAIDARDWQRADEFAQAALIARPGDPDVLTDVARVAAFCDRKREAALLLIEAAKITNFQPESRVDFAIQALIDVGEMYRVIELLEESLLANPENHKQRRMLVGFLGEAQRLEKVPPHLQKLIQSRNFDLQLLAAITETSVRRFSSKTPGKFMQRNPNDHRVRLAEAFEGLEKHDVDAAARVLEEILNHHPDFAPAHAMYGQVLTEQGRWDEIPQWIGSAPPGSEKSPDHWLTRGDWAAESDRRGDALRAYLQAAQRDPSNSTAWTRLIATAKQLRDSDSEFAAAVSDDQLRQMEQRLADLIEFRTRVAKFNTSDKKSQRYATEVAESLLKIGRTWEAEAWSAVATTLTDDPAKELDRLRTTIVRALSEDPGWLSKESQAVLAIDLSSLPATSVASQVITAAHATLVPAVTSTDHIRLSDESDRWGLANIGANNNPDRGGLTPLIRSTAAGGGAIDYDLDGYSDLVVMGAAGTMQLRDSKPNDLMRNLGDRFSNVTAEAGATDRSFGQGVAVGDVNEDGFPDLFFANLGKNRLFGNNGDGTFADWTDRLVDGEAQGWTTCGAIVDVNEDGLADLLTINYCDTAAPVDKGCPNEEGILGPCPPLEFPADHDQFFVATGDGKLVDTTADWVPPASPGRGLGIIAGALDGRNLGIYIANDMSANMYYTRAEDDSMRLIETAAARGVAVDGRTLTQASMGIACSDFDLDGDLDLYVTGFGGEYNVLYDQLSAGLWKDVTGRLGLVSPTLDVLGFGTEAIDLDSDGIDEIVVTNGHIGDFPLPGALPYEQPLQLFRRGSTGRFELLIDDQWGEYFGQPHVGRALWSMDVNRDGRNDVLITHAHEPVRLLVNRGRDQNSRIAFKLIGTSSSRDAIGAIVRLESDGRQRTLWSLAGDGYMCSNERILRAGVGSADEVTGVTVTWQDGSVDRIGTLETNAEYTIVQGGGEAFRLADYPSVAK